MPVPTPNAPESPESLPECIRISSTRTTQITTWIVEKTRLHAANLMAQRRRRVERVDRPQDLDRLGAQLAVERAEVLLGELAGAVVGLVVADLRVLRLLRALERAALVGVAGGAGARRRGRNGR